MKTAAITGALCAMLTAWPAASQDLSDLVDAEVLPGWREDGGRHMAAVRLSLAPGWKTYWRSPGDAGIPPRFDWSGTQNVSGVAVHWPVPIVFYENGYRSVGYSGEVTIPLEFVTPDTQAPIALDARLDIGVCEEVCVPVSLHLQGLLEAASGVGAAQIRGALDSGPMSAREAGVGDVVCRTEPISDGLRLTLSIDMPRLGGDEAVVVELADPAIWVSEPTTERSAQQMTAVAELVPPEAKPFAMARQDVRITVLGDGRAVDIRGCTGG